MISFYFLSVFQRATFEIVIHIPYTDTWFGSITRSGSRVVPASTGAPPPPIWIFFHIVLNVHYLDFKKQQHPLHIRIRQLPGASPPGPPPRLCPRSTRDLRAAPDPLPSTAPSFINSWIRHYVHFRGNDMFVGMLAVQCWT